MKNDEKKRLEQEKEICKLLKVCDDPKKKNDEKCLECVDNATKALELAREKKLGRGIINHIIHRIAIRCEHASKLDEALKLYNKITVQDHSSIDGELWCDCMLKSGVIYWKQANYPEAKQIFSTLLRIYEKDKNRENQAKILMNLAIMYSETGEYKRSLELNKQASGIFEELNNKLWIYRVRSNIANCYYYLGDLTEALKIKLEVIHYYESIEEKIQLSLEYNTVSVIYRKLGDIQKAIDFCFKSLKIKEELKDKFGISTALTNLGVYYRELGIVEKAVKYYNEALELKRKMGDRKGVSMLLNNIGNIHLEEQELKMAEKYFRESYEIKKAIKDREGMLTILENLSELALEKQDFDAAYDRLKEAKALAEKIGSEFCKHDILQNMADVLIEKQNYDDAQKLLEQTNRYFSQKAAKQQLARNYELYARLYEEMQNYDKANRNLHKYLELREEIFNEENSRIIAGIQSKYEIEKKEKEAEIYRLKNIELKNKNKAIQSQKHELETTLKKLKESEIRYDFVSSELNKNIKTKLIGESEAIRNIIELISTVAHTENTNVLISGESGTGKEIIARKIHECSSRKKYNFFAVNCSAIPTSLFESQFFGHEKNAFTGADQKKMGWFEIANNATLFLDEISTLTWEQQAKLLRVLEERKIVRVGSHREIPVDLRIISATNTNLLKKVEEKKFRNDLYHRLATFVIHIPPLRERKEDIPLLLDHFIGIYSQIFNKKVKKIEKQILPALLDYSYPGNIRELRNMVERALVVMNSSTLRLKDFVIPIAKDEDISQILPLEKMEKKLIKEALQATHYNKSKAAELLKVHRKVIERRVKKYDLDKKEKG